MILAGLLFRILANSVVYTVIRLMSIDFLGYLVKCALQVSSAYKCTPVGVLWRFG